MLENKIVCGVVKVFAEHGVFKLEARNPKFETICNAPNPKHQAFLFWTFGHLNLGFV